MSERVRASIITAAAGGIGGALVEKLLAAGEQVLAVDISSRRLAALEERARRLPGRLVALLADVTDEAGCAAVVGQAEDAFGTLHGLANIAGGIAGIGEDLIDRRLEAITLGELRDTMRLNLESAFLMARAIVPAFRRAGYGKIVNVASLAAFGNFGRMGNSAYDAAKAAVIGLTQTLSRSLGADGIRVNVVAPGMVYTERVAASFGEAFVAAHRERTPVGRLTTPEDAADLIAYLLGPGSDQVSGEVIRVSGGLR